MLNLSPCHWYFAPCHQADASCQEMLVALLADCTGFQCSGLLDIYPSLHQAKLQLSMKPDSSGLNSMVLIVVITPQVSMVAATS